jgi:hypothetical protein
MAAEFVPLEALLDSVHASLVAGSDRIEGRRGEIGFTVGECTVGLSVELRSEGERVTARFPSALEGDRVPPEYLSRLTLTLRRGLAFEPQR